MSSNWFSFFKSGTEEGSMCFIYMCSVCYCYCHYCPRGNDLLSNNLGLR